MKKNEYTISDIAEEMCTTPVIVMKTVNGHNMRRPEFGRHTNDDLWVWNKSGFDAVCKLIGEGF